FRNGVASKCQATSRLYYRLSSKPPETLPCRPAGRHTTRSTCYMPLPTLPTKLGTLLSEKDDSVILADPPVQPDEPDTPPARPAAASNKAAATPRPKQPAPVKTAPAAPTAVPAPATAAKTAPAKSTAANPAQAPRPAAGTASKRTRLAPTQRKLFVLDTNVLLHDSNSLFKFEEHDIFLPM